MDITLDLEKANQRLKDRRAKVSIEARGKSQMLYLRFTDPSDEVRRDRRCRIALLMPGTPETVMLAEDQAIALGRDLATGQFSWDKWGQPEEKKITVGEAIAEFKEAWLKERRDQDQGAILSTWRTGYNAVFNKKYLDADAKLSTAYLRKRLQESFTPNNSQRSKASTAYAALLEFHGFHGFEEIRKMRGNYTSRSVDPRNLPTDESIAEWYKKILEIDRAWATLYGLMAAYGLRNHEVFLLDFREFPEIWVGDRNKTKDSRVVRPLYPEWAERWHLYEFEIPQGMQLYFKAEDISKTSNCNLGKKMLRFFDYRKIPFRPYDLRHCYARRSFEFGIEIGAAARSMGHSRKIHEETYRRWITEEFYAREYTRRTKSPDAPKAPEDL